MPVRRMFRYKSNNSYCVRVSVHHVLDGRPWSQGLLTNRERCTQHSHVCINTFSHSVILMRKKQNKEQTRTVNGKNTLETQKHWSPRKGQQSLPYYPASSTRNDSYNTSTCVQMTNYHREKPIQRPTRRFVSIYARALTIFHLVPI